MTRITSSVKWLYPGMRVKRWLLLAGLGVILVLLGLGLITHGRATDVLAVTNQLWNNLGTWFGTPITQHRVSTSLGYVLLVGGCGCVVVSINRMVHSLTTAVAPRQQGRLVDMVYRNSFLAQSARVVVIGGGTGLSTMLRGLKQHTNNIVAIVTVTDDGGSSGRLTRELNMLPPGDIRNCLVALADSESTMTDLFQHRFRSKEAPGLRDHAFGNLLIAALCEISEGDFEQAVRLTSRVLNIRGVVLPSTLTHVTLKAEMDDGSVMHGETSIAHSPLKIKRVMLDPPQADTLEEVVAAIENADVIVIGPGSVYTSVAPNLLVRGMYEALKRARAPKVYVCNVMTQPGETDGFAASDHLKAVEAHVPSRIIDYILVNRQMPSTDLLEKYRATESVIVEADIDRIKKLGYKVVAGDFINQTDVVRHDPNSLADAIMKIVSNSARS